MGQDRFEDAADLLRSCRERDEAAWSAFMAKYGNLIYIAARNRLRQYGFSPLREDINDIRQDVLQSIWNDRLLDGVRNAASLPYWLAIVSGNAAMQHMRRQHHGNGGRTLSLFDRVGERELIDLLPSPAADPADGLEKEELSQALDAAIEALPVQEKLVIKLNLMHDKQYDEIAGMLGIPISTVSSHIKRAKEKIRRALKDFF